MPHLYEKKFRGRTYWYLREVHRVDGKVRLKWQKYLGTAETILAKIEDAERAGRPVRLKTESFGAIFVAHCLERELDTIGIIDSIIHRARNEKGPTVGEYFFYAWANRMIDPRSKRGLEDWYRTTAIQQIRPVGGLGFHIRALLGKMGTALIRANRTDRQTIPATTLDQVQPVPSQPFV